MSRVIIYSNAQGGVSVCVPTGEIPIEAVLVKDCPSGAVIVEQSVLPSQDGDFFNAWEMQAGNTVTVSIPKAREITKARLRLERKPLLEAQDVLFQRALETGAPTAAIVAEKQRLRDITLLADSCTTTAELRVLKC
jgi:hypothetical protein